MRDRRAHSLRQRQRRSAVAVERHVYGKYLKNRGSRSGHSTITNEDNALYIFRPPLNASSAAASQRLPFILHFHGGGFHSGYAFSEPNARIEAAVRSGAVFISVNYRLCATRYFYRGQSELPLPLTPQRPQDRGGAAMAFAAQQRERRGQREREGAYRQLQQVAATNGARGNGGGKGNGANASVDGKVEELIVVDGDGRLHLDGGGRTMDSYRVRRGRTEFMTKPAYDAAAALEFLLAHAAELRLDPHRMTVEATSAGGGPASYLLWVYRQWHAAR